MIFTIYQNYPLALKYSSFVMLLDGHQVWRKKQYIILEIGLVCIFLNFI